MSQKIYGDEFINCVLAMVGRNGPFLQPFSGGGNDHILEDWIVLWASAAEKLENGCHCPNPDELHPHWLPYGSMSYHVCLLQMLR